MSQPMEDEEVDGMSEEEVMDRADRPPSDIERDQMIEFGHDDLEMDAPEGPNGDMEESVYSHKTTTILDEDRVSFMQFEQLPNQDNTSDDNLSEHDMVYYNKDDLTNYSRPLGLNKVKAKK